MYTHEVKESDLENFEESIKLISMTHTFIKPNEFFEWMDTKKIPKGKFVMMTFDDGFLSSFNAAKKVLDKYGIKAIFFVPTAVLELKNVTDKKLFTTKNIYYNKTRLNNLVPDEFLFMNAKHLIELENNEHMVCPHTHNHVFVKEIIDLKSIKKELIEPKEKLETLLNKKIRGFAFPVGTNKQVSKYSYKYICLNYEFCFTALSGLTIEGTNKHKIPRSNFPADAPKSYIDMVLKGYYDPYHKFKMDLLSKKIS